MIAADDMFRQKLSIFLGFLSLLVYDYFLEGDILHVISLSLVNVRAAYTVETTPEASASRTTTVSRLRWRMLMTLKPAAGSSIIAA